MGERKVSTYILLYCSFSILHFPSSLSDKSSNSVLLINLQKVVHGFSKFGTNDKRKIKLFCVHNLRGTFWGFILLQMIRTHVLILFNLCGKTYGAKRSDHKTCEIRSMDRMPFKCHSARLPILFMAYKMRKFSNILNSFTRRCRASLRLFVIYALRMSLTYANGSAYIPIFIRTNNVQ